MNRHPTFPEAWLDEAERRAAREQQHEYELERAYCQGKETALLWACIVAGLVVFWVFMAWAVWGWLT